MLFCREAIFGHKYEVCIWATTQSEMNGCCWVVVADFVANFVGKLCCFVVMQFLVANTRYAFGQRQDLKWMTVTGLLLLILLQIYAVLSRGNFWSHAFGLQHFWNGWLLPDCCCHLHAPDSPLLMGLTSCSFFWAVSHNITCSVVWQGVFHTRC